MQLSDYHYSDCTAQELVQFVGGMSENSSAPIYELPGHNVQGEQYIEFNADDEQIQQLVLKLFYMPVEK